MVVILLAIQLGNFGKFKKKRFANVILTLILTTSFKMTPAVSGAMSDMMFAKKLVIPIKVPAKFGAISMCTNCLRMKAVIQLILINYDGSSRMTRARISRHYNSTIRYLCMRIDPM